MRHPTRLGIALAVLIATAGCSAASGDGSAPDAKPADGASAAASSVTSCGRQVTLSEPPKRAVALDQASTETLLELGLQDRMAGTANLKTKIPARYESAYAKVPVIAPKIATAEQLRAATPDFVLAGSSDLFTKDRAGTREELDALKVPTFVSAVDCPERNEAGKTPFELLFSDYENLGKVFGAEKRADALADLQRAAVAKAGAGASKVPQGADAPTVVYLYSVFNGMPYVAGGTGLPSEMSRIVGAKNAFDDVDEDWPEVSWEEVAKRDPDFIVIGDLSERGRPGDSAAEKRASMKGHPVVSRLAAVRDDRILEVPGIELDPSVRSVHTLGLLADGMKDLGYAR
ncbi:ABC transporter (Iron.B12.siderophore.hemin), periplasmic substrate-binding component [Streptomyces venezuelae]|uniref:ABC transporter substrate-binding protein n=1 Tax=Streptomyces gardneri TaxID=66892 RepID=UPI0006BC1B53|nr:ABC transporter substrate-binding protein [Streptomyces gardneri]ALO12157.1 ABC transporter (Iron.B12.siderophore.hemin), periplasmic substrate-binding component [Streptomyces venezuelae]QPK48983.1 ABC transporter substrate-binding protein [Streptomyces gardneri]WRK40473.1 ABC transporter substrate-binding protein [Streptomyces venezuelae]CUM37266.1 ABC transporter (iron.B12.siderophore.hemin), periplasmic substrate-binding component [Streptomyces venezuelae]